MIPVAAYRICAVAITYIVIDPGRITILTCVDNTVSAFPETTTISAATVTVRGIAIVAHFTDIHIAVAAYLDRNAVCAAAIAADGVSIVTHLARLQRAIATFLQGAIPTASVTVEDVAVVAALAAPEIGNPVAAAVTDADELRSCANEAGRAYQGTVAARHCVSELAAGTESENQSGETQPEAAWARVRGAMHETLLVDSRGDVGSETGVPGPTDDSRADKRYKGGLGALFVGRSSVPAGHEEPHHPGRERHAADSV